MVEQGGHFQRLEPITPGTAVQFETPVVHPVKRRHARVPDMFHAFGGLPVGYVDVHASQPAARGGTLTGQGAEIFRHSVRMVSVLKERRPFRKASPALRVTGLCGKPSGPWKKPPAEARWMNRIGISQQGVTQAKACSSSSRWLAVVLSARSEARRGGAGRTLEPQERGVWLCTTTRY